MSEIEKIKRYIRLTKIDPEKSNAYSMSCTEMCAFYNETQDDLYEAMFLIFNFGRAKGYRAAKAEARR